MNAFHLAAKALALPRPEQLEFLKRNCGGDDVLHREACEHLKGLLAARDATEVQLASGDPLASLGTVGDQVVLTEAENASGANGDSPAAARDRQGSEQSFAVDPVDTSDDNGTSADPPLAIPVVAEPEFSIICERFHAAWRDGSPPDLSSFLPSELDPEIKTALVYRLVQIDVAERLKREIEISEREYLSRFPEFAPVIRSALTRRDREIPEQGRPSPSTPRVRSGGKAKKPRQDPATTAVDVATGLRYQPIRLHAKGGLGEIHSAKDMELGRLVAFKRIRPEHDRRDEHRARFVFEAEVTGSLEHPGIVPVYGLGCWKDDRPYYTMRFIRGNSFDEVIKAFHRRHTASSAMAFYDREFRQLLKRLIDCCNAMHYAHERGVLHRDLKPANIMLGNYGETLVVDWGLARLLSEQKSPRDKADRGDEEPLTINESGSQTRLGTIVGTPVYMSPEQAHGMHDQLTPASDVYSLGAILFFLMSGEHPIKGKSPRDVVMSVREGNIRDLGQVAPNAPRPLVSISQHAMRRDAEARYPSAAAMAEDIERWLSDEAVQAHADRETTAEKAGRLIRRYRGWTVSGAVALLTITLVSIVAAVLIRNANRNEQAARRRAQQYRGEAVARYRESRDAIDTWLVQSSDAFRFFPGTQSIRSRLLTIAAEDYAKLSRLRSGDPELELERARAVVRLGDIAQLQEDYDQARRHYQEAITLLQELNLGVTDSLDGETGPDTFASFDHRVQAEAANAKIRVGLAYANEERLAEAEQAYAEAYGELETLTRQRSDPQTIRFLASGLVNGGELALRIGQFDRAETRLSEAFQRFETLGDETQKKDQLAIARTQELLGRLAVQQDRLAQARDRFDAAASRLKPLVDGSPDDPEYLDALASLLVSAASVDRATGNLAAEEGALREAVAHYRTLSRSLPDVPTYAESLALTLTDWGLALIDYDQAVAAQAPLGEANELARALALRYGTETKYEDLFAANADAWGQSLHLAGEFSAAREKLASSAEIYQSLVNAFPTRPDYVERLAIVQSHLAQTLAKLGTDAPDIDRMEVEKMARLGFQTAGETLRELAELFEDRPRYRDELAHVRYHEGLFLASIDPAESERALSDARDLWEGLGDERSPASGERLAWLLSTSPLDAIRDPGLALELASELLTENPNSPRLRATTVIAASMTTTDGADTALKAINRPDYEPIGRELLALALWHHSAGSDDAAAEVETRGREWFRSQAPMHPDFLTLLDLLAQPPSAGDR